MDALFSAGGKAVGFSERISFIGEQRKRTVTVQRVVYWCRLSGTRAKRAEDIVIEKLTPPETEKVKIPKAEKSAESEEPQTELEKLVAENKAKKAKKK